jgi:hypothetical protein
LWRCCVCFSEERFFPARSLNDKLERDERSPLIAIYPPLNQLKRRSYFILPRVQPDTLSESSSILIKRARRESSPPKRRKAIKNAPLFLPPVGLFLFWLVRHFAPRTPRARMENTKHGKALCAHSKFHYALSREEKQQPSGCGAGG